MQERKIYVIFTVFVLALTVLCVVTHAQPVHVPDPNLRAAVREALNIGDRPHVELTQALMRRELVTLRAPFRGIENLEGLQYATYITRIDLDNNNIVDIRPLAQLRHLTFLRLHHNHINDLSPLANLTGLTTLLLEDNNISDIGPLANLTNLERLELHSNRITDIRPLVNFTNLDQLQLQNNLIVDHSPLANLSIATVIHDEVCDLPSQALDIRIAGRGRPSIFGAWLKPHDYGGKHDMVWNVPSALGIQFKDIGQQSYLMGFMADALASRDTYAAVNSHIILLAEIRMFTYPVSWFPEDWPHWLRDGNGHRIIGDGRARVNYAHPEVQGHIIQRVLAVARCGLFDGIYIDHWREQEHLDARLNILRTIRERTRPEFVIIVNTNDRLSPHTAPYINGGHMENGIPGGTFVEASTDGIDPDLAVERFLLHMENTLAWNENHVREPRLNCFESRYFGHEAPDSALNRRWMRAMTSMTLVYSDGYVLFSVPGGHDHIWYDFWDADLGQPVGEKEQLYQETDGLYIREFTNGWAVYNHSGAPQAISLPDKAQGVASGWVGMAHVLPDQDGEMYLKVTVRNPADVNRDGVVNIIDLTIVAQAIGTDGASGDVNGDGVVNVFDLVFVAEKF